MTWQARAITAFALLALAPSAVAAATGAEVQTTTLANGLRLVLAPDPSAGAVDIAVWYDSGTRSERAGQTGIAHLFEHLMFRGSAKYGPQEHSRRLQALGGVTGAYTTADLTCFFETVPPNAIELALALEADRMTTLAVTQANLDAERRAVAEESARRFESTPFGRGLTRLYATAFSDHPYRWPVLGNERDLTSLTLADAKAWYRGRFGPERTVVTVVGRFDPVQVTTWARREFERVPRGGGAAVATPKLAPQTRERRAVERADVAWTLVLAGWRGPARGDADLAALQILSNALTRGETALVPAALARDEGPLLDVQGDLDSRRDASLLYLVGAAPAGADTAAIERRLLDEVQKVVDRPLSDAELERAKNMAESAILFGLQTVRGRAQTIGSAIMLGGDAGEPARQIERIRALTAADVQKVAARHLAASRRSIVWVRPSRGPETGGGR